MAHLSEEHFRAKAIMSTPKSKRTSGRLRGIFKPRRSTSSSPKTLTKSSFATAKLAGVLSSDSASLQAVAKEEVDVRKGDVNASTDPEGSVLGEVEVAFAGFSGIQAADEVATKEPGANNNIDVKEDVKRTSKLTYANDTVAEHDAHNHQKSCASNIFDDQDSLSAGIREYVESKIAEAFHAHSCDCPVRSPLNITTKFELNSGVNMSRSSSSKRFPADTNILLGRKCIGPFIFKDSSVTTNVQMGIIGAYMLTIMLSAFLGPKALFLTVWRSCITLTTYSVTGHLLGWKIDAHSDLLLAPALHVSRIVQNFLCNVIDQYGIFKVYLNSQIMRESLVELGAVFDPKH